MIKLITCEFSVLRKDFIPKEWKNDMKGNEDLYIALATLYSSKYHNNTQKQITTSFKTLKKRMQLSSEFLALENILRLSLGFTASSIFLLPLLIF
jgi:hypothetical protein